MSSPYLLFVDDDPDEIDIALELFREANLEHRMKSVHNGVEALAFLENAAAANKLPVMLVLDINMPKMNGIDALKELNKMYFFRSIQVFMHSTAFDDYTIQLCQLLGVKGFIRKSRDNEGLKNLIQHIGAMIEQ